MSNSRRSRRMAKRYSKNKNKSVLNLTALMDIFTILVFFLMVNQSTLLLQGNQDIEVPESVADGELEEDLTIVVSSTGILIQDRLIVEFQSVGDELSSSELLVEELRRQAIRVSASLGLESSLANASSLDNVGQVNSLPAKDSASDARAQKLALSALIVGDKDTAYPLLEMVMNACAATGFNNIALAVSKAADQKTSSANIANAVQGEAS